MSKTFGSAAVSPTTTDTPADAGKQHRGVKADELLFPRHHYRGFRTAAFVPDIPDSLQSFLGVRVSMLDLVKR
jgi:hypothetical protein